MKGYVGYIDNETANFEPYIKRLKRKNINLICKDGGLSKEQILEWLVEDEIKCFMIDYRLKPDFAFEGTELLFYINGVLPDLPCVILTNYPADSVKENLVEDYMVFDRAILDSTGEPFDKFVDSLDKCIKVFDKRMQLRMSEYETLFKKRADSLTVEEFENFKQQYKLLKAYGYVDDIPEELLSSDFERKLDHLLDDIDKLLGKESD